MTTHGKAHAILYIILCQKKSSTRATNSTPALLKKAHSRRLREQLAVSEGITLILTTTVEMRSKSTTEIIPIERSRYNTRSCVRQISASATSCRTRETDGKTTHQRTADWLVAVHTSMTSKKDGRDNGQCAPTSEVLEYSPSATRSRGLVQRRRRRLGQYLYT